MIDPRDGDGDDDDGRASGEEGQDDLSPWKGAD